MLGPSRGDTPHRPPKSFSGVTIIFGPPGKHSLPPLKCQFKSTVDCIAMCQCTVYAILTVRLLHYHHIGTCTYFISQQTRNPVSATIEETVLIHNSGHFGPPLPFWALGPPALPGLPMASYAAEIVARPRI